MWKPSTTRIVWLKDDVTLTTWLLIGATLQYLTSLLCGARTALLLAAPLILTLRLSLHFLRVAGILSSTAADGVLRGNKTTKFPNPDGTMPEGTSEQGIVMLVLGARSNQ